MTSAAIFDLDRTLISGSSATIFQRHLVEADISSMPDIPFGDALVRFYETFGENWFMMQPARLSGRAARGWSVDAVAAAMKTAADELAEMIQPFAPQVIEEHRSAGRLLLLATTSPEPFVRPLAQRLGFHDVVATKWRSDDATFLGELDGAFVWGRSKFDAVSEWAKHNGVSLQQSYAYSDSYFDAPLLAGVGHPTAVNPDAQLRALAAVKGWPVRHFDVAEGVSKILGREVQDWIRPFLRPELVAPMARFEFDQIDNIPISGPAILVFNHRSYFDPSVLALLAARAGRSVRALGKKEVFDVPVVGNVARWLGGIRVERASGSDEPLSHAANALRGGDLLMLAPQGTIPRGPAFFDPVLKGRWGAARLAAMTHAPVIPVGLWGTEKVWPRSERLPRVGLSDRPLVSVTVGPAVSLGYHDAEADTKAIMAAISDLLPSESRRVRVPTEAELAMTFPPGYSGDPNAEVDRRPGTDS